MRFFKHIQKFFWRIRLAWKLSKDPRTIQQALKLQSLDIEQEQIQKQIANMDMQRLVATLVDDGSRKMKLDDPRQPLHVKFKSGEVIGSREADMILEESLVDFQYPSPFVDTSKHIEAQQRLDALNKKIRRDTPSFFPNGHPKR